MQLVQEQLDLVPNSLLVILKKHANVDNFSLELEHVVEDQVGNDHESLPANVALRVLQEHKDLLGLLVEDVGEAVEQVSYRDDNVGFDSEVYLGFQQIEKEVDILSADLRGDTHEFA